MQTAVMKAVYFCKFAACWFTHSMFCLFIDILRYSKVKHVDPQRKNRTVLM